MVIFKSASFRVILEFLPKDNFILFSVDQKKTKFIKITILFKKTFIQNHASWK